VIALVASNAKGAFTEIIKDFESKHKGVTVKAKYLGGATIGKMVDEQEPADMVLVKLHHRQRYAAARNTHPSSSESKSFWCRKQSGQHKDD
jgi:ABC-type molybdate transport system substrate-binding protein